MATTGSWNNGGTGSPITRTNIWGTQSYTLSGNEIFGSLFNLLISARTFTDNVKGGYNTLADRFKIDGSLYGDFKTFKGTDVLKTQPFTDPYAYNSNGNFQGNLLKTAKPADPKEQYVQIDQVRFIELSLDMFLTKRAFYDEGSFSEFHGGMLSWMQDTKRVYESGLINTFVGTTVSNANKAVISVDLTTAKGSASTEEEARRLEAQEIAKDIADLLVDVKDYSRDYTDWKLLRAVNPDDLLFVWNSKYLNKLTKMDLPTIYHKDGLIDKMNEELLPPRFFGRAIDTSTDKGSGKVIKSDDTYDNTKGTIRALAEKEVTVSSTAYHLFPGDEIPNGATVKASGDFELNEVYLQTDDIICKVIHKSSVPFMSAYESEESFYNQRSKVTNFYLHFMYSKPCYLYNYPFLTVKSV